METEKEKIEQFIEKGIETEPQVIEKEPELKQKEEKQEPIPSISPKTKDEDKEEVSEIEKLQLPGKVERLFNLADSKGLFYAIEVAKKTGDGFLIDTFRDRLAQDKYYEKYLK